MNKIFTGLFLMTIFPFFSNAQYYYKDFIGVKQAAKDMAAYKKAGIHAIKIKSYEANGEESEDFFCEKKISKDYKKASLYTRSGLSGKSLMESFFNEKGLLIKTYDSSEMVVSSNLFEYDEDNRLVKSISTSKSNDDDFLNEITDEHIYNYKDEFMPLSMTRIKNNQDSLTILFSLDESGNIAVEKDTKTAAKFYYYYDQNGITDVVHSNEFKNKLIADYIFEYNEAGQISQMTTTEEGDNNYFVWKYNYENNLKMRESIFSKDGMIMGKIEYEYK